MPWAFRAYQYMFQYTEQAIMIQDCCHFCINFNIQNCTEQALVCANWNPQVHRNVHDWSARQQIRLISAGDVGWTYQPQQQWDALYWYPHQQPAGLYIAWISAPAAAGCLSVAVPAMGNISRGSIGPQLAQHQQCLLIFATAATCWTSSAAAGRISVPATGQLIVSVNKYTSTVLWYALPK